MNTKLLPTLLFSTLLLSATTDAQTNRAFAVTSETKGTFNWNVIREIDLSTGDVLKTYYDQSLQKEVRMFTDSKVIPPASASNSNMMPMGQGVAAAAYDAKHNRLYYTPMRGTDLRYFDLNDATGKVIYNQNQPLFEGNRYDEANVITRMAFASDGYGYAITNDGKNLIRFTTDQKPAITNLGELIDGKKNGTVSVHNQCSSWGGDMVGDAYGNLYLVTIGNHLFKINPQTRITDYIGAVSGLPPGFTSNGMVVDADGDVVLSSAAVTDSYYRLNISTLKATPVKKTGDKVFNSSDLANGNLLYQITRKTDSKFLGEVLGNDFVSIYPNPVQNKLFNVQFDRVPAGRYNLVLSDASAKIVLAKTLQINSKGQREKIVLPKTSASGMYFIKLTGSDRKLVYSDKIIIE
jgi:hypothetical protein